MWRVVHVYAVPWQYPYDHLEGDDMSLTDPLSDDDLRALARKSRAGKTLSRNESFELNKALKISGPLARQLQRILDGEE